jgi:hypothetical protein
VVGSGNGQVRSPDFETALAQTLKRLRRSYLVHQMQIDIQQGGRACLFIDYVRVPDFFDDGSWLTHEI